MFQCFGCLMFTMMMMLLLLLFRVWLQWVVCICAFVELLIIQCENFLLENVWGFFSLFFWLLECISILHNDLNWKSLVWAPINGNSSSSSSNHNNNNDFDINFDSYNDDDDDNNDQDEDDISARTHKCKCPHIRICVTNRKYLSHQIAIAIGNV